ncbi:alpha/beta hydrolase [Ectobacillus sp. JY-23]|uniref:alpha/beta fold hydrolase n=1 Tax=Ectobacillus sp. JY-23 TaxID=2933872 RepID=UPI001FF410A6|nr:alpha/beta hydrolase [Ectobacillus sp. JY-23]UOY92310.1 alpha/beta hydrolase [Ectobacillus sp. JY-23]
MAAINQVQKVWETTFIETERGIFEVFIKGTGEPLCITHLYSEFNHSGDYFADIFTNTHQVFLVNLRGVGGSETEIHEEQLSMLETVRDLDAIKESLGFSTWHFAGHSTGGMLGLLYAIHFGSSLESLIVVGSAASKDYALIKESIYNPEHPQFDYMQELAEALKVPNITSEQRKELSINRTKLSLYKPENYQIYFNKNIQKRMSAKRMNYFSKEFPNFDLRSQLKKINVKTLVICGNYDVQCPIQCSLEIKERIANSTLIPFKNSNHYPFLEEGEKFINTIHEFYKAL